MKFNSDFWKFWTGQTISNLGTSLTLFAIPLLAFTLTHSPIILGIAAAVTFAPYLLFGLIIGAWVDRFNRKRLMILGDLTRALLIASIPLLSILGYLPIWWIYIIGFINTTLAISFDTAEFAAIPSLVKSQDITTANGRILASYSAAMVIGPLLGGLLITVLPIPFLMFFDAGSFLVSACSLLLVKMDFNVASEKQPARSSIRADIVEGLHFVLGHPVLRNIAFMLALVNLLTSTVDAQIVLFVNVHLHASPSETALFYSAGGLGVVVLSLLAGWLRKHFPIAAIILGSMLVKGLLLVAFALTPWYVLALFLWAGIASAGNLLNINTNSFRQTIVPNHMLGRVRSISIVFAWSVIPIGSLVGGIVIEKIKNITLVYGTIGVLLFITASIFAFTEIRRADSYVTNSNSIKVPTNGPVEDDKLEVGKKEEK